MKSNGSLKIEKNADGYHLLFFGSFGLQELSRAFEKLQNLAVDEIVVIDFQNATKIDPSVALYIRKLLQKNSAIRLYVNNPKIEQTLNLSNPQSIKTSSKSSTFLEKIGIWAYKKYCFFLEVIAFVGMLFIKKISLFFELQNFRYKEILYEIYQSGMRAVGIVALTSFLVGVVVAYQSAVQLKMYGANIFIVDMLGISMLRELAPMITAIIIAGRSGSAYTAEIGAMKITEELDAMKTMGFDPYFYIVIPRIFALAISLPILIFVADIAGVFGGMLVSLSELDISFGLFLDRFRDVIEIKHFVLGEIKGPFFAFLIALIAIYRGLMVKDDTQSIGKNTTKSVVESIFAVIICDAIFSVIFTNLGW